MLYEHKFDCKTRGLVCGTSILVTPGPVVSPIIKRRGDFVIWDAKTVEWRPVVVSYKVVIRSRETKEQIWVRPFATKQEALFCYISLIGLDVQYPDREYSLPPIWQDGDLEYYFATVTTYNSTTNDSTKDWSAGGTKCPTGVTATDYLLCGGGGGGGGGNGASNGAIGGGGGAGGLRTATGTAVTAGTNYAVTVGTKGVGQNNNIGTNGGASTWNSLTSDGGGGGGSYNIGNGQNGGSGGGGAGALNTTAGTATGGGTGNSGGTGAAGANYGGGGGGGAGGTGGNGSTTNGGNGGTGSSSSISGSSLFYAGGGGGAIYSSGTPGTGGSSIGGAGSLGNGVSASPANRGSGGGGGDRASSGIKGGDGSDGVLILSWTAAATGNFLMMFG